MRKVASGELATRSLPSRPANRCAPASPAATADGSRALNRLRRLLRAVHRLAAQLSVALRRKLGRGATYNVKVLLRGDAMTGKTSLLRRLQGLRPTPEYAPTRELGVAHVDWASDTEDVVKLEVWDVVDRAKGPASPSLALEHHGSLGAAAPAADAESVDVVRGAHAVVFLIDRRKRWTFEYVERALAQLPDALPVAFVVNFADALRTMTRTGGEAPVEWDESSRSPTPSAQNGRASACARRWSTATASTFCIPSSSCRIATRSAKRWRAQADVAARMQRGHAAVLERARAQQPHAAQPRPPEPPSTPPSAGGAAPPATPPSVGTVERAATPPRLRAAGAELELSNPPRIAPPPPAAPSPAPAAPPAAPAVPGLAPGIDEGFFDDDDAAAAGGVGGAESGAGG